MVWGASNCSHLNQYRWKDGLMRRRLATGASILVAGLAMGWIGGSVGAADHASGAHARSGVSSLPPWLHKTMYAKAYVAPAAPFVPNVQPVGMSVPASEVTAIVSDGGLVRFGLASLKVPPGQTYPALSTDSGTTWRVDGPLFHVNAAQAASVVGSTGAIPPRGAYFWGQGGNIIWITYDEGAHWSNLAFAAGVDRVSVNKGTLDAVVLGKEVKDGDIQRFLYVSTDSGRTWKFHSELTNLKN